MYYNWYVCSFVYAYAWTFVHYWSCVDNMCKVQTMRKQHIRWWLFGDFRHNSIMFSQSRAIDKLRHTLVIMTYLRLYRYCVRWVIVFNCSALASKCREKKTFPWKLKTLYAICNIFTHIARCSKWNQYLPEHFAACVRRLTSLVRERVVNVRKYIHTYTYKKYAIATCTFTALAWATQAYNMSARDSSDTQYYHKLLLMMSPRLTGPRLSGADVAQQTQATNTANA